MNAYQWLETIADEKVRKEALENYNPKYLQISGYKQDSEIATRHEALECSFNWVATPQGEKHWIDIYSIILNHGNYPAPPINEELATGIMEEINKARKESMEYEQLRDNIVNYLTTNYNIKKSNYECK